MGSTGDAEQYDYISLGSGEAGKHIAWFLGPVFKRRAVIERKWFGGSCPQVACMPSKNVIHSAKKFSSHGDRFGLGYVQQNGATEGTANMGMVKQRKIEMVKGIDDMHTDNFEKTGAELIWGDGRFVGPKSIEVTDANGNKRILTSDTIVICTGSRAQVDDTPGLKESNPMTHVEMLDIAEVPKHLIIIGAGYVGLEFAQAMKRFGAAVTVVDRNERILKREDEDIATTLQQVLEAEGVVFSTSTSINSVSGQSGDAVTLKCTKAGESIEIKGSHILCATGRLPNNENIGLELAGVKLRKSGHIAVDEWNRATEDGIFAVGDCAGSPYFTHMGFDDFRIVREYVTGKGGRGGSGIRRSNRQIPFTLFTDPEFAHVGLREHEAKAKGIQYRLAKLPIIGFARARTSEATTGFAKALIADDDTILGFSVVGPGVGELLPVIQLAMKKGLPYTDIGDLVLVHPTLSEGLEYLFAFVPPKA